MIETNIKHCNDFAKLILGKSFNSKSIDLIINDTETFAEFRIVLIMRHEKSLEISGKISKKWYSSTQAHVNDGNALMHTSEKIATKQIELEATLRECTSLMLDKLKLIDALTTKQRSMDEKLFAMGDWIVQFQKKQISTELISNVQDSDANHSMHAVEILALKQSEIQKDMRDNISEILNQFKAVDSMATLQVTVCNKLSEIKDFVAQFQNAIIKKDSISTELQRAAK